MAEGRVSSTNAARGGLSAGALRRAAREADPSGRRGPSDRAAASREKAHFEEIAPRGRARVALSSFRAKIGRGVVKGSDWLESGSGIQGDLEQPCDFARAEPVAKHGRPVVVVLAIGESRWLEA